MEKVSMIIGLITLAVGLVGTILGWVISIRQGQLKVFVEEKMMEAESKELSGEQKLAYVLEKVKEKYKVLAFIEKAKEFIDELIKFSKKVNSK